MTLAHLYNPVGWLKIWNPPPPQAHWQAAAPYTRPNARTQLYSEAPGGGIYSPKVSKLHQTPAILCDAVSQHKGYRRLLQLSIVRAAA